MKLSSVIGRLVLSAIERRSLPRQFRWRSCPSAEVCETRLLLSAADLDPSFDHDGKLLLTTSYPSDLLEEVLIRPDGKVITVGSVSFGNGDWDFIVHQSLPDGTSDPNFGTGGVKRIAFDNGGSNADFAYGAALQPDGKLVVVGSTEVDSGSSSIAYGHSYVAMARLTVSGNLDPDFGIAGNGKRTVLANATYFSDVGRDVLVQPDGKIIVVGDSRVSGTSTTTRMFMARLDSSGSILAPATTFSSGTTGSDLTLDAVLQPDGKVLVTGYSYGTAHEAWVVRLKPQSSDDFSGYERDTSFSQDGRLQLRRSFSTDLGADSRAIALQPDGKIVIAGSAIRSTSDDPVSQLLVARIETDGTLDPAFGVDGSRQVAFTSSVTGSTAVRNWATSIFVQPDGKIVAGGVFRKRDGNEDFAVVRLLPNGDNDINFYPSLGTGRRYYAVDLVSGSGGDDNLTAMALGTDGKIYLAGNAKDATGSQSVVMRLVGDPNYAPSGIELSRSTIDENLPEPALVGTFSSNDTAETGTHTYTLVSGSGAIDNARFLIDGNSLYSNSVFDFESKSAYTIRVRSTDPYGLFYERTFQISVRNLLDGTAGTDEFTMTYSSNTLTISMSTNGGTPVDQGTFSFLEPVFFEGLTNNDTVRVVGSGENDTFERYSISHSVNGSGLAVTGAAKVILVGGAGSDSYRFPLDAIPSSPVITTLDEAGGGIDTLDFSGYPIPVAVNLGLVATQTINSGISLNLKSNSTFERVIGTAFSDSLVGNGQNNTLTGGSGDDKLNGGAGSDMLLGGPNNDTYQFTTASAAEVDQVTENTNEGIDTLNFSALTSGVNLHLGSIAMQAVHTNRTLKLNSPNTFENSVGGSGADSLVGNGQNNTLTGGSGDDKLNGGAGSDMLLGGPNNDTYQFTTASAAEVDQVTENTNEGIDTLNFSALTSGVNLHLGSIAMQAVHTNRTLKLNSPNTFENSVGGSGADSLVGNGQNNTLTGGSGDDKLNGGAGSDMLLGGPNNDTYQFTTASAAEVDQVTENTNEGIDTLNFSALTTSVNLHLGITTPQTVHTNRTMQLNSASTIENAIGGSGSDTLLGNSLANRMTGGDGNNILVGLEGADILEAGSGRDILIGGLGLDSLNGGAGDDILIAGRTASDTSLTILSAFRTQWISANTYAVRVANLRAGVGSPAASLKAKNNVLNDAGEDDALAGGTGTDWYFRALDDVISGLVSGELIDVL